MAIDYLFLQTFNSKSVRIPADQLVVIKIRIAHQPEIRRKAVCTRAGERDFDYSSLGINGNHEHSQFRLRSDVHCINALEDDFN